MSGTEIASLPLVQQAFEVDATWGMPGCSSLERKEGGYVKSATQNMYDCYTRGWQANKARMDRVLERLISEAERSDPENIDTIRRAYLKLRMEMRS